MPPRIGHTVRRHPLCPQCKYDLVATIDANRRACPECGHQFTLDELIREVEPGQWTEWIGLRRAVLSLLWRSAICLPIWAALAWLVIPLLAVFPADWTLMALIAAILAIPGAAIGHTLAGGLTERAGFSGPVLTILAAAFAAGVCVGGVELAERFRPLGGMWSFLLEASPGLFAVLWIMKVTVFED